MLKNLKSRLISQSKAANAVVSAKISIPHALVRRAWAAAWMFGPESCALDSASSRRASSVHTTPYSTVLSTKNAGKMNAGSPPLGLAIGQ